MILPPSAVPVALDALPRWSHWPGRLLCADAWNGAARTIEKIDREYDKDKYAACLAFYHAHAG